MKLDLACGQRKREGFLGCDIVKTDQSDFVHDLTIIPWPWEDNSIEEVHCSHFFEHLTGQQRIKFMEELWRILIPNGTATIICPYWNSFRAHQDPTHIMPGICEGTMLYFNKEWMTQNGLNHYPINPKINFNFSYVLYLMPEFAGWTDSMKEWAVKYLTNSVSDIQFNLTKIV